MGTNGKEKQQMRTLLRTYPWGAYTALVAQLLGSPYGAALENAIAQLQLDALYQSPIHGSGHILRVMVHGAMGAMEANLSPEETALLLDGCAYHDVGRKNDSVDKAHGARSAQRLSALTGRTGRSLALLQAAVTAHSLADARLAEALSQYGLAEDAQARSLALMLKDADGLDRVRIWDLDPGYLRFPGSVRRAGFAEVLYRAWISASGEAPAPSSVPAWKGPDESGNPPASSEDLAEPGTE